MDSTEKIPKVLDTDSGFSDSLKLCKHCKRFYFCKIKLVYKKSTNFKLFVRSYING